MARPHDIGDHPQRGLPRELTGFLAKVAIVALALAIVLLLWFVVEIPLLFFGGVLVATVIRSMSVPLSRLTRLPHGICVLLVVLAFAAAFWQAGALLAPAVGSQFDLMTRQLPAALENLQTRLGETAVGKELLSRVPSLKELLASGQVLKQLSGIFSVTLAVLSDAFILLFTAIYLTFDPDVYIRGIVRMVPLRYEKRTAAVFATAGNALRRWILGQLTSMAITGILTGIGLWILGIPLALTLGLLAGLLTFIPYIGAVISAVPAVLFALLLKPALALWVVVLYLGVHTVEAYIVTPVVQQHQVQLPPVLLLLVQFLLGYVAGFLGLTLATPLTATFEVFVKMLYVEDVLGKKARLPGGKEEDA